MGLHRKSQRGFTLIEIMVTLVIMAFSVLGAASMLIKVNSNAVSSMLRTQASVLIMDMSEKLTANRAGVLAAAANYTLTNTSAAAVQCNAGIPGATVAQHDTNEFVCQSRQSLPSGVANIAIGNAALNPVNAQVTVTWDDSRATGGNNLQSLTVNVRLK